MLANLLSVYHMTIPQIGALTDAQINRLYFHPRQEDGTIEPVVERRHEDTLGYHLLMLEVAAAQTQMKAEQLATAKATLRKRWSEVHGG